MKKKYVSPELETIKLGIITDILVLSDPEPTVPGGGGGSGDTDPFGDLNN